MVSTQTRLLLSCTSLSGAQALPLSHTDIALFVSSCGSSQVYCKLHFTHLHVKPATAVHGHPICLRDFISNLHLSDHVLQIFNQP